MLIDLHPRVWYAIVGHGYALYLRGFIHVSIDSGVRKAWFSRLEDTLLSMSRTAKQVDRFTAERDALWKPIKC